MNLATALAKSLWGHYSHSISMQADGIHSFLDAASNVTGLIGIWFAAHPPDKEHPYGHQKFETFAAFCISVLLFLGCYRVLETSYARLQDGVNVTVTSTSFLIMFVTLAMNLFITTWEKREGNRLHSEILIADAAHTKSDIYVSLSVIAGLIAGKIGYPALDPVIAVVIAGIIGKVGWEILLESSKVLADVSRIDARKIITLVMTLPEVETCHAVRTRGSMSHVHVDLHIHVNPEMSVGAAHEVMNAVEDSIMDTFQEVAEVIVHVEPHVPDLIRASLKND